jgi:hypothetical protein
MNKKNDKVAKFIGLKSSRKSKKYSKKEIGRKKKY